jgi:hypothetical protein
VEDTAHLFAAADGLARVQQPADELLLVAAARDAVLLAQLLKVVEIASLKLL